MSQSQLSQKKAAYLGASLIALGVFLFTIGNAFAKEASATVTIAQVIFIRCLFGTMLLSLYVFFKKDISLIKTKSLPLQLGRGVGGFLGLFFLFKSCNLLPLSEATAISFAATIFITALSVPLLKEHVGIKRWSAVLIGFIGILIVVQPSGDVNLWGATTGIISALFEALIMILARILGRQDQAFTTVFYHTIVSLTLSGIMCCFEWVPPSTEHIMMLGTLGFCGVMGHVVITHAYKIASAVVVAPMLYTQIIWGGLVGYFVWGEVPNLAFYLGVLLVILSGVYTIYLESKKDIPHIQAKDDF